MSDLGWEDEILLRTAMDLVRRAELEVADALLASSTVALRYGSSWSDGFDDYIYDVEVTIAVARNRSPALTASEELLRSVLGDVVSMFHDEYGSYRRADLVRFLIVDADEVVGAERVEQRRAAVRKALQR